MNPKGKIYLIPAPLGDSEPLEVLPISVKKKLENINYYIVEKEKTARHFIKRLLPGKKQSGLVIEVLDKYTREEELHELLAPCLEGTDAGVLSEAGLPAIADPGASLVRLAHRFGLKIIPLTGPSSIFLALSASGMNGQNFAFNGYLPIERHAVKRAVKKFEKRSADFDQTQIFIETPYRNDTLLETLLQTLSPATELCVAVDLTLPGEQIISAGVADWQDIKISLHKRPAVFLIYSRK